MIDGLLGRKLGMIQVFDQQGRLRGATVIEAGPCLITQIRTQENDGYTAVQLGYGAAKHTNKPMRGHLKRLGDLRYLREFPVDEPDQHKVGDRVGVELFQEGDRVHITGESKGRGFAGSIKRHHFAQGPKTHGQSDRRRAPGSIGSGNTPGRVFKGMRMAGHMGAAQVTVRNLEVLQSDPARGILIVAGSAPGGRNSLLKIRYTAQTRVAVRDRKITPPEPEVEEAVEEQETPEAVAEQPPPDAKVEEAATEDAAATEAEEEPDEASSPDEDTTDESPAEDSDDEEASEESGEEKPS